MRLAMPSKISFSLLLLGSLSCVGLRAASPENAEQEYQQVRKIALRDSKVRGAYEDADRKLEEKILQIDPALADYVHHRSSGTPGGFQPAKATPHPKPSVAAPESAGSGVTYVVKKGDTLGMIANEYHVTVTALKAANHIVDEKKLAVGQTLAIPASGKKVD
jgi:LysM repeat protein